MARVAHPRDFFRVGTSERSTEEVLAKAPGVGVAHVIDPTLNTDIEVAEADPAIAVFRPALAQAVL